MLGEERYKLTSLSKPEVFCIIQLTDKKLFSLLTFTYEVEDDVILATMLTSTIVRVCVFHAKEKGKRKRKRKEDRKSTMKV